MTPTQRADARHWTQPALADDPAAHREAARLLPQQVTHFRESCNGDWSTICGINLPGRDDDPPSTNGADTATCGTCLRRLANRCGQEAAEHRRSMDHWLEKANRFHALADAAAAMAERTDPDA